MIAIVNYGVGNLFSLCSSLRYLDIEVKVTDDPKELDDAKGIILPGVGAFGDAIEQLRRDGLDEIVCGQVKKGKPLLGICLGMQLLYDESTEYGTHKGLGLLSGRVISLREKVEKACKVPQMGWNSLATDRESQLLRYTKEGDYVYYVHSFYAPVTGETVAHSEYGGLEVTGVAQRDHVYGTQFHPEKSGKVGLDMLRAFSQIK